VGFAGDATEVFPQEIVLSYRPAKSSQTATLSLLASATVARSTCQFPHPPRPQCEPCISAVRCDGKGMLALRYLYMYDTIFFLFVLRAVCFRRAEQRRKFSPPSSSAGGQTPNLPPQRRSTFVFCFFLLSFGDAKLRSVSPRFHPSPSLSSGLRHRVRPFG